MDRFDWNDEKNQRLQQARGVSFEDVVFHIQQGHILDIVEHRNPARYPTQKVMIVNIEGYAYLVPFVQEGNVKFMKTIIPSRKATKEYLA